jgi:hypothetical protein
MDIKFGRLVKDEVVMMANQMAAHGSYSLPTRAEMVRVLRAAAAEIERLERELAEATGANRV